MNIESRTATVSANGVTLGVFPRATAFGYADFMTIWGDPEVQNVTCVGDDGLPVTLESLTPRELLEARLKVAEMGARCYGTPESRANAQAQGDGVRAELAAMPA